VNSFEVLTVLVKLFAGTLKSQYFAVTILNNHCFILRLNA